MSKKEAKIASKINNLENAVKNLRVKEKVLPSRSVRGRKRRGKKNPNNTTPGGFNALMGRSPRQTASNGESIISHTEYWFDINITNDTSTSVLVTRKFTSPTFPTWLAAVAKNYERYDLLSCTIHYRTSVGTTTSGSATIAVDWDPSVDEPTSAAQVYVKNPVRRSAIWKDLDLPLPQNKLQPYKDMFVKPVTLTGATPTTLDRSSAAFQAIAYVTHAAAKGGSALGEIWISYRVKLKGAVM